MTTGDLYTVTAGVYESSLKNVETKNYNEGVYHITITFGEIKSEIRGDNMIEAISDMPVSASVINGYTTGGVFTCIPFSLSKGRYSFTVSSSAEPKITSDKFIFEVK